MARRFANRVRNATFAKPNESHAAPGSGKRRCRRPSIDSQKHEE